MGQIKNGWIQCKGKLDNSIDGWRNLRWREEANSHRATGVGSRPPQKARRVSRVNKSFHFLSSKGIAWTFPKKSYGSSVISRWREAEKQEKHSVNDGNKVITDTKAKDSPDSLMIPHILSNSLGILAHSSGLHTHSILWTKKYLFFQFLLESGMSDTNLSNGFLAKKW